MNTSKIIEISRKLGLSHIGSCLSTLPILEEIYEIKNPEDLVILDSAHAHLAHLMFTSNNPEEMIEKYGIHCDTRAGCVINGGSLGHAGGYGIGMALVNRNRNVYVIFSDGSMAEGSNWEALRIREELGLYNMKCYFNFNGNSALKVINLPELTDRVYAFCPDAFICLTTCPDKYAGVQGHYCRVS